MDPMPQWTLHIEQTAFIASSIVSMCRFASSTMCGGTITRTVQQGSMQIPINFNWHASRLRQTTLKNVASSELQRAAAIAIEGRRARTPSNNSAWPAQYNTSSLRRPSWPEILYQAARQPEQRGPSTVDAHPTSTSAVPSTEIYSTRDPPYMASCSL